MSDKFVFLARSSFFKRSRLLTVTGDYISLGQTDDDRNKLTITKDDIDAFKYTARRVRYFVYLYNYYKIDIRGLSGQVIKIRLFSFMGINSKQNNKMYSDILDLLHTNYFIPVAQHYLDLFANNIDFNISGLIFTQQGLKFSGKNDIIPWTDVETHDYYSHYAIFSKTDKYNYRTFDYWNDWNTTIILTLTRAILHRNEVYKP